MPFPRVEAAVFGTPWAIVPSKLDAISEVLERRLDGGFSDLSSFRPDSPAESYRTADGIAVIPIRGVMGKRMNLLMEISGGTSTELAGAEIQRAVEDPGVRGILLDIDSPGGSVDGSFTLADLVSAAAAVKPMVAFVDGDGCSAAYLVACSAGRIVAGETADVGSIGVVTSVLDRTEQNRALGIRRHVITAGRYKAVGSPDLALDRAGEDYIRGRLDVLYGLFVDRVAAARGVSREFVLDEMADGRVFLGREALARKMVDVIGERGDALRLLSSEINKTESRGGVSSRGKWRMEMPSFMQSLELAFQGKSEEIAEAKDRENAEAVVALARAQGWTGPKAAEGDGAASEDAVEAVEAETKVEGAEGAKEEAQSPEKVGEVEASAADVKAEAEAKAEMARNLAIRESGEALGLSAAYVNSMIDRGISVGAAIQAMTHEAEVRQSPLQSPESYQDEGPKRSSSETQTELAKAYQAAHAGVSFREALVAVSRA